MHTCVKCFKLILRWSSWMPHTIWWICAYRSIFCVLLTETAWLKLYSYSWHFTAFQCAIILASTVDILAAYFAAVHGNVDLSTYCAVILASCFIHFTRYFGFNCCYFGGMSFGSSWQSRFFYLLCRYFGSCFSYITRFTFWRHLRHCAVIFISFHCRRSITDLLHFWQISGLTEIKQKYFLRPYSGVVLLFL